jgi:hypothetical protein
MAMLAQTDFVALFDDDTVPGTEWFENCLNTYKETYGILGGVGLRQHNAERYMDHTRFGWPSNNEATVEVDLVGHAWFINKKDLKYIWMEEPVTYETAEDIQHKNMVVLKHMFLLILFGIERCRVLFMAINLVLMIKQIQ